MDTNSHSPVLPIDALLPEILASLECTPNLVLEAPPGAGKTTRVPPALLDTVRGQEEVWVLEPRRLAARMASRRVAEERGERPGETVGYQVRFEEVAGPATRLRFLTEGMLTRRLLSDPQLACVGTVVLDEFHERHLQADLGLALLRRLQQTTRPDLRIVVMSATLEAAPVVAYLGDCPQLRSEGRMFEVKVEHQTRPDERPLSAQVGEAVLRLVMEGLDGDVLVFLPGAAEIRRAQEACASVGAEAGLLVLPLHGELPAAEQDRAVRPAEQRKVILSTNVAESSLTIEGVVAVIDSGLARAPTHSPWSGLPALSVGRISQSSALQRAGRAGRTRPGRCLRLYTAQDFAARPAHEMPEIQRLDLAEPALELHANSITRLDQFDWFEPPPEAALEAAEELLQRLKAIDANGAITDVGKRMLRFPLHPRLARMVVEGEARGVSRAACVVAALVSERDIRSSGRASFAPRGPHDVRVKTEASVVGPSDLLELLDLFTEAERERFALEAMRHLNLEPGAVRAVERVRRQLQRLSGGRKGTEAGVENLHDARHEEALLISILTGYPDRVARRRSSMRTNEASAGGVELLLAGGGGAQLASESVVKQSELLVAVDAEQRRETGAGGTSLSGRGAGRTMVRLASAVEPEWLLDLFTERITETNEATWNAETERVEVVSRLLYDRLVLDERGSANVRSPEVSRVLAEAALNAGPSAFAGRDEIERFHARVGFVASALPETNFPTLAEDDVREALIQLCEGKRSFAELREAARAGGLLELLRQRITPEQARLLAKMAPERVALAIGRQVRVNYEPHRPPWIASRLQDFFGMREGPQVAGGRVPVVLRLLAPNQRPVQVTTDLAGFWQRHYPQIRRELSRRYPHHAWPEEPS
ncbi:MAG: ATP-dependent helicase HrpB [Pyrinomonadaceae bacterium]